MFDTRDQQYYLNIKIDEKIYPIIVPKCIDIETLTKIVMENYLCECCPHDIELNIDGLEINTCSLYDNATIEVIDNAAI